MQIMQKIFNALTCKFYILFLDKICQLLTHHMHFYYQPPQSYQLSKTVRFFGPPCSKICDLQSMSADKNDQSVKQLMTGGVGSVTAQVDSIDEDFVTQGDQHSLWCIKLKLFGNCGVGKTTLIESLRCGYIRALFRQLSRTKQGQGLQSPTQDVEQGLVSEHEGCTRCIDIQHISISGTQSFYHLFAKL